MRRICIGHRYRILSLDTCAAPRASTDLDAKREGYIVYFVKMLYIVQSSLLFLHVDVYPLSFSAPSVSRKRIEG